MALPFYVYDLLYDETVARWGADRPVGTPITLTYSFPSTQASGSSFPGYTPFTAVEMTAARNALSYISSFTNITFTETSATDANLRFGNADLSSQGASVGGYTNYSFNSSTGLTFANINLSNVGQSSLANSDFAPGSITSNDVGGQGWQTLIHEIGHAMGLKHPFDTNRANDPNSVLPTNVDNIVHSVMSYTQYQPSQVAVVTGTASSYSYVQAGLLPQTYSLYDIAALQYLYGSGPASAGNKVYTFTPASPIYMTISDKGPNDTIDCSALTGPNTIDMTPGAMSNLAIRQSLPFGLTLTNQYDGTAALTIAYGCIVANCIGGSGSDTITGNTGNNTINGGGGIDTMSGGGGNDVYIVDNAGDIVHEAAGGGSDRVAISVNYALGAGESIEALTPIGYSSTSSLHFTGNALAQAITGNAGNNILDDGGAGAADTMTGLGGNDIYVVANAGDIVREAANAGNDRVTASIAYVLTAGQSIENLSTTNAAGTAGLNLTGNTLAQTITGNAGANTINDGGPGAPDTMIGLAGNDIYLVNNAGDVVNETGGADRVIASVSYALTAGQAIELLSPTSYGSTKNINLTGNDVTQSVIGNAGVNVIDGKGGNDTLTGNGGNDFFLFDTTLNASTNVDRVTDFAVGADIAELSRAIFSTLAAGALSNNAFFAGTGAHDADDRIIYNGATGALTYDSNGNVAGGATQFATLATGLSTLGAGSFKVV